MSRINYKTVLGIINNINLFAEESDQKIHMLWSNHNSSKQSLEEQLKNFLAEASDEFEKNSASTKRKANVLNENADKIYREVSSLDTSLANYDKYYVKTRSAKIQELAQRTESSIVNEADVFVALGKVKDQFKSLSSKYSMDKLPAMFDGLNYFFSKQRKQDYEELIVLKNTLEKLMKEINNIIPELINDSTQVYQETYNKRTTEIKEKYRSERSAIDALYESNVESLADEICEQLDMVLPDEILQSLKLFNEI